MLEVNVELGRYEADFVWREPRFVVETDGYRFDVQRLSDEQIDEEPERVATILRGVLAFSPHRVGSDGRQET